MAQENRGGIVNGLIYGLGALVIVVIVIFVVISTIDGANLLRGTSTTTTISNESGWLNGTGYTLADYDANDNSYVIVTVYNGSGDELIPPANYTLSDVGVITNSSADATSYESANITYTYAERTDYEKSSDGLVTNMTKGVDNVSSKIPTILLIGAVVLLFGVIVLLVRQSQAMGIGGSKGGSL